MKRRILIWIATIGIMVQFGTLAAMIVRRELTLKHGVICRFRTAPVDPYDAFRGRYVALSIDTPRANLLSNREYANGQRIYARIGSDTNGLHQIERLALRPDDDAIWMKTHVSYCYPDYREIPPATNMPNDTARGRVKRVQTGRYRVNLRMPFDRYYMEEALAPRAEQAYRGTTRGKERQGVVIVRIWRGFAVITGLEIDGRPIAEVARDY